MKKQFLISLSVFFAFTAMSIDPVKVQPINMSATAKAQYKSALDILTKTESTALFAAKLDTTNIVNASWYSDTEVDALLDSVRRIIPFVITIDMDAISSPADATTYYFGFPQAVAPDANVGYHRIVLSQNCKLVGYSSTIRSAVASQETFTVSLRKNNSTDYTLAENFLASSGASFPKTNYSNTLNNDYSAGDYIEIKMVTPTWATNPTAMYVRFDLYFIKN